MTTVIKNGWVLDSDSGAFSKQDIFFTDELLASCDESAISKTIDATNLYITPGLIDTCSQIGLRETGVRWEGNDSYEPQQEDPTQLSVTDGIYPFDSSFKDAVASGVTTAHILSAPNSVIGAKTAIIHMNGSTVEEMLIDNEVGFSFSMGDIPKKSFMEQTKMPLTRMGIAQRIRTTLKRLKRSGELDNRKVFVRCHRADDIETAIRISKEVDVPITLVHATECGLVDKEVLTHSNNSIGGPSFQAIERLELKNLKPTLYKTLQDSGVNFGFATDHPVNSVTHLKLEASLAFREGVSSEDALLALTKNAAKLLEIDHLTGSIAPGLFADIVIWDQHPLNLTANVLHTFIKGQEVYCKGGF
ncbi:amidohydrolase family protein [Sporosarcina psychrophila]|uniref:Imidazolonepropionase-like amidohydrolase n=1 Tax=Sporosarcina psychrophila TaxID=1476 RepID=A0ABV2K2Y6_SPOPS